MDKDEKELLLKSAILAGKLMLENGAEMYRVEDTMNRIVGGSSKLGDAGISFVVPTALFIGIKEGKGLRMERSTDRSINLEKISEVNQLSRAFTSSVEMDVYRLYRSLQAVEQEKVTYPNWLKIVASAIVCGSLMILFDGTWADLLITMFIGAFGYYVYLTTKQQLKVRFIPDFIATFAIGILTIISVRLGWIASIDSVIIGSIMMLVPGVHFTNAVRDLMVGNTISGTVFAVEALTIGIMIGTGITLAFQFI